MELQCADPITGYLYDLAQIEQLPEEAVLAALGCGNPTALADWKLANWCLISDRA
jgi:hypothetical protein